MAGLFPIVYCRFCGGRIYLTQGGRWLRCDGLPMEREHTHEPQPCNATARLDDGLGVFTCDRPVAHEGDHGQGETTWSRGGPEELRAERRDAEMAALEAARKYPANLPFDGDRRYLGLDDV